MFGALAYEGWWAVISYVCYWHHAALLGSDFLFVCVEAWRMGGPISPLSGFGASTLSINHYVMARTLQVLRNSFLC